MNSLESAAFCLESPLCSTLHHAQCCLQLEMQDGVSSITAKLVRLLCFHSHMTLEYTRQS